MALTKLGKLAYYHWVNPARDFSPALTTREIPTLSYAEGGRLALPRNYRAGLITSLDTDTDHDINIAVGQCRDSTDTKNMLLETTITKQIDATWAGGDDAGGLNATDFASGSSGTEPDTWYHVYLIKDTGAITAVTDAGGGDITCAASSHLLTTSNRVTISGTLDYDGDYTVTAVSAGVSFNVTATFVNSQTGTYESVDAGFDKSTTAVNLLSDSGYTYYRRVGSIMTDATAAPDANIRAYVQRANEFIWSSPQLTDEETTADDAAETVTLVGCPTGFNVLAVMNVHGSDAAAWHLYISPLDASDMAGSYTAAPLATISGQSGEDIMQKVLMRTNTSGQFRHRSTVGVMDDLEYSCLGWFDDLGDYD